MSPTRRLRALWQWARGNRAQTLLYHSISDDRSDPYAVSPKAFAAQLEWLARNGFAVISDQALIGGIEQGRALSRAVVLTFDDALRDFFDEAMPVLSSYRYPATVFVPTGKLGQTSDWAAASPGRPLMSEDQLLELLAAGFELGSHTVSHASLPALDDHDLRFELERSRRDIERLAGHCRFAFAYPYGRMGQREQQAVRAAGYAAAYLAGGMWGNGRGSDRFAMTRKIVGSQTTLAQFARLASGWADLQRLCTPACWRKPVRWASSRVAGGQ